MTQLFYKERTSASLNNILLSAPYFKDNWKLIPRIVRTLNKVLARNHRDNGKSDITYKFWADRFGGEYPNVVLALESLGLMTNDRIWIQKSSEYRGKCYSYLLTPQCQTALADANKEYLYLLLTDKATKRRNQKQISGRGHKVYGDVRDILKDGLDDISFDPHQVEKVVSTMPVGKQAFVWSLLIDIVRKDYTDLHHNAKDNRIWTPYTQLPSEIRAIIKVKGLSYQQTIDIRSCYPSLWAEYVSSLSLPHSVCGKADNLNMERKRWNNLFLDPKQDPKAIMAKAIGVSRQDIKEVMIQYFNGKTRGKAFKAFDAWISKEYPALYSSWKTTDIKQTGNRIGYYFETRLMLDASIYKKAKALGLILAYEYDGASIYGKDDSNCQTLLDFIEQRSIDLLGVKLVFVNKVNVLSLPAMLVEHQQRYFAETHKRWLAVCRRTFRKENTRPDWETFRMEQTRYQQEKNRVEKIQEEMAI